MYVQVGRDPKGPLSPAKTWDHDCFLGEPVPGTDHLSCEEPFPHVQSEFPLMQFHPPLFSVLNIYVHIDYMFSKDLWNASLPILFKH